ncbi:hypothetical protein BGW37DRAFT_65225 [Umbelopsis sp. PMI_123]|nr:hypothetical protein BGW37DRAFT_65225 [Umbelopsis sp. PMI_123]
MAVVFTIDTELFAFIEGFYLLIAIMLVITAVITASSRDDDVVTTQTSSPHIFRCAFLVMLYATVAHAGLWGGGTVFFFAWEPSFYSLEQGD